MPDTSDYETQPDWMEACVPVRVDEGDEHDQAVAACLNIWREREGATEAEEVSEMSELRRLVTHLFELVKGSLGETEREIRQAFDKMFGGHNIEEMYPWVNDVFVGHPEFGDSLVVEESGKLFRVTFEDTDDEYTFADRDQWQEVVLTYALVGIQAQESERITENAQGQILRLVEASDNGHAPLPRDPLTLQLVVIQPGLGNAEDRHYYGKEMLRRDAHLFEGAKMYATDHRNDEKSVRTEVAKITQMAGFTTEGAPIAEAVIFNADFAENTRNRAKAGILDSLECSILASGLSKEGEVEGLGTVNIVESITAVDSVDFVTRAGAGGRALALVENERGDTMGASDVENTEEQLEEEQKPRPVTLREEDADAAPETAEQPEQDAEDAGTEDEEDVKEDTDDETPAEAADVLAGERVAELLAESGLGAGASAILSTATYRDEEHVKGAIERMSELLNDAASAGKPFAQGRTSAGAPLTREQRELRSHRRFNETMRNIGAREVPVPSHLRALVEQES